MALGNARTGDLVELAAVLGDGLHTYTLCAQTPSSMLMLPIQALKQVFEKYPPLRMRLLEELAREVSRAYISCCVSRDIHTRTPRGRCRGRLRAAKTGKPSVGCPDPAQRR